MALRDKELKAAKAQLQRRDSAPARALQAAAEAAEALAAARAEVRSLTHRTHASIEVHPPLWCSLMFCLFTGLVSFISRGGDSPSLHMEYRKAQSSYWTEAT